MDSLNERISLLIKELGATKTAFSEKLNVSQAFVSQICSGVKQPSDRTIADICREFGVSEEWLRTGRGEMFVRISPDEELDYILGQVGAGVDETIVRIIRAYWKLDEKEKAAVRKLIDNLTEQ